MKQETDWFNFEAWRDVTLVAGGIAVAMLGLKRRSPLTLLAGGLGAIIAAKTAKDYVDRSEAAPAVANAMLRTDRLDESEQSITISAPPAEVFAYVDDLSLLPQFIPIVQLVNTVDDKRSIWTVKTGPASVLIDVAKSIGPDDSHVTLGFLREGTFIGECTIWLRPTIPDLNSTHVTLNVRYHPFFFGNSLIRPRLNAEFEGYLNRLKERIETGEIARAQ